MADRISVYCLFVLLMLHTSYAGLPGLSGDAGESDPAPSSRTDNELLSEHVTIEKMMVKESRRRKFHKRYKCHQCEPPDCTTESDGDGDGDGGGGESCDGALYCYKSSTRDADGAVRHARGCTDRHEHYQFTCSRPTKRHAGQLNVTCCKGDLCNRGDFPQLLPAADMAMEPLSFPAWRLWTIVGTMLSVAALAVCIVLLMRRTHRLRVSRAALHKLGVDANYFPNNNVFSQHVVSPFYEAAAEGSQTTTGLRATAAGDSTLREYLECSATSGSGSGLPLMVQRTLAKQIALIHCVGKGRFGEVWRGLWHADHVAVKIFFSRDEASWRRETDIYSTVLLRHDNILAYVGSDMTSRNSCTQLWLITHYHPLGSLYEHLARAPLSRQQMMRVCLSVVNGLLHLHTEIHGTQGKPAIAHRDIKSKNILVKSSGECCIADFGLAVTRAHVAAGPPAPPRQGTKRYMSPELLDQSMNLQCFESYRKCDIYALALVLWEVVWRSGASGREPRAPYAGLVGADPSFDEMRKIVCVDGARPPLPRDTQPTMLGLSKLIRECWHANPAVRLPALRIKKSLLKLAHQDNAIQLDMDDEVSV